MRPEQGDPRRTLDRRPIDRGIAGHGPARRLIRLLDILHLSASGPGWTAGRLASHFGVSRRRLFEDLHLLNRAGLPVIADRSGYRPLRLDVRLPVTLTVHEILALLRPGGVNGGRHHQTAQVKLSSALPSALRGLFRDLRRLRSSVAVTPVDESIWRAAETALMAGRRLEIGYRGLKDRGVRERSIEPQALFMKGTGWYLVAWVENREEPRLFRLDRIEKAVVGKERCVPRPPFDLAAFMDETPGIWRADGRPLGAQVEVLPSHVASVRSEALARGYEFRRQGEGAVLTIERGHVEEAAWWLAPFGEGVRVVRPPELRARLAALGRRIVELNGG